MKLVLQPILCLFAMLLSFQPSLASANECKLIVASRSSILEGRILALEYRERFTGVEFFEAKNGWYAISVGTLKLPAGSDVSDYIELYDLPEDSFCMSTGSVARLIDVEETQQQQQATTPSQPDRVAPTKDPIGFPKCPKGYGFEGIQRTTCIRLIVPPNASLDYSGNNWACDRGYLRRGDQCNYIIVPTNAHLTANNFFYDPNDNGWACDRGYRQAGDLCEKVFIPENAQLNIFGNGYSCISGYVDSGNSCRQMTYDELFLAMQRLEQYAFTLSITQKSCSQIVSLCEDVCRSGSFSFSRSRCEEVCEEMEDKCD